MLPTKLPHHRPLFPCFKFEVAQKIILEHCCLDKFPNTTSIPDSPELQPKYTSNYVLMLGQVTLNSSRNYIASREFSFALFVYPLSWTTQLLHLLTKGIQLFAFAVLECFECSSMLNKFSVSETVVTSAFRIL